MKTLVQLLIAAFLLMHSVSYSQCDTITGFPFTESFEDNSPTRDCWTQQIVSGNNQWSYGSGAVSGPPTVAFDGSKYAYFTDEGNGEITKLISPVLDLSAYTGSCILTFYYAQYMWSGDQNILNVYFRTSSTAPWILLFTDNANRSAWTYKMLELPSPTATYQIAFEGVDNYGYPNAVDLVSVLPPCSSISQFPFTETFEDSSPTRYCWSQELVSGNKSWSFQSGALEGSLLQAHSGDLNAVFTNDWGFHYTTKLVSPVMDLSTLVLPAQLNFYYAQEANDGNQNALTVFYRKHPDSAWKYLFADSTNRPSWTHGSVMLPELTSSYQLAFEGYTSNGYANVIDKVMISECPVPQNLQISGVTTTEATVSWMNGGFEYAWDVRAGAAGFNPDISGNFYPDLNLNTLTLNNLTEGTLYDVYIRPVCNALYSNPWIGPYRFYTRYNLPYTEDFDDESLADVAPGWSSITETQISWHNPSVQRAAGGFGESYCALLDDCVDYKKSAPSDETQVEEVILISPEMLVPLNTLRVKFKAAIGPGSQYCGSPGIAVGTMSDPTSYGSFTEYTTFALTEDWTEFTVNLNLVQNNDPYIAFRLLFSEFGFGRVKIDDVRISLMPSCIEPVNFEINSFTGNEVNLQWMPGQGESSWDILYDNQGFNPLESGILVSDLMDNSFSSSGLESGMMYDFYVRADCGNGDTSEWLGPLTVATPCGSFSAPVVESFDGTAENQLPLCWNALYTMPSAVLTVTDFNTSEPHALMMLNDPGLQDTVYFISPLLADPLHTLMISFNAYAYDWLVNLSLGTLSDPSDPSTFTAVADLQNIPMYTEWAWDFYDYTGTDQYIAFRLIDDAAVLLDDIVIEAPFVCQMPQSLNLESLTPNSLTLSWIAANQETSWNVIFGEPGFDPWVEGTLMEGITENPYTISGLDQGTAYDIYVSAQCFNGDWSEWAGPVSVTTSCEVMAIPFDEGFDGLTGTLPDCWYSWDGNNDGTTWTTGDDGSGNQSLILTPPGGQIPHNDWFFSPPFQLLAGHVYTVSFDYKADQPNPNNQISVFIGPSAHPEAMNLNSLFNATVSNTSYENASFTFMPAADGIQVFGWYCMSGSPQSTMYIDNISITETVFVNCPPALSLCAGGFPVVLNGGSPAGGVYSGPGVSQSPNQEFIFDPTLLSPGTYTLSYTYTTQFGSNSCDFEAVIHALPEVNCPEDLEISFMTANFSLSGGSPAGGTYFGQSVVNNMFNPTMAPLGPNTVGYMYTDPLTQCQGFCDFVVNVIDTLTPQCPGNDTVCANDPPIVLSGGTPEGGYYSGNAVYATEDQQFVFVPGNVWPGSHVITYTRYVGLYSYSCTFIIHVQAPPEVFPPANFVVYTDDDPYPLSGGIPAGGTYSGPAVSNNTFYPQQGVLGENTVTYTYTDPLTQCSNSASFIIHLFDAVSVMCPSGFSVCQNSEVIVLNQATPTGGSYSGAGVSMNGNQEYQFDPALAGPGLHTITYNYPTSFGDHLCDFPIEVTSMIFATCPPDLTTTSTSAPFALSGGLPAGGTYAGQAVVNNMFYPSMAQPGLNMVSYTYLDYQLLPCTSSCSFQVDVTENVSISCPDDTIVCINTPPFVLTGEIPAGGIFSGPGVYQNQNLQYLFNPAMAGVGEFTITYTYATPFNTYTCTYQITVIAIPIILSPNDFSLCLNDPPQLLTGGIPVGGTYSGPGVSNGIFDPAAAGVGLHTITYIYTDSYGCSSQSSFTIQVMPLNVVSVQIQSQNLTVCSGQAVDINALIQNAGSNPQIQWYVNNNLITQTGPEIQLNPLITSTVYSVVTAIVPCSVNNPDTSNTLTINVLPAFNPSLSIAADDDTVCAGVLVSYHVVSVADTGSNPVFQWQVNGMNVGANAQSYSYIPGNADLVKCLLIVNEPCVSQSPVSSNILSTIIIPTPVVSFNPAVDSMCITWAPVLLTGGTPLGGTYSGPGVVNQSFNPMLAGAGTHTISYTFADTWGCQNTGMAPIFVDLCTGIATQTETNPIILYPNPANETLLIRLGNKQLQSDLIRVTDLMGKQLNLKILLMDNSEIMLDIRELSPGMYTLHLDAEYFKFMIIR